MRIQIVKDGKTDWVKPDRLQRFLDNGWQQAQPSPERPSKSKPIPEVTVEAIAEVITEEDFEEIQDDSSEENANQ